MLRYDAGDRVFEIENKFSVFCKIPRKSGPNILKVRTGQQIYWFVCCIYLHAPKEHHIFSMVIYTYDQRSKIKFRDLKEQLL